MLSLGKNVYTLEEEEEENARDVSIFKCKTKPDLLNQHRLSGGFHLQLQRPHLKYYASIQTLVEEDLNLDGWVHHHISHPTS